jgi:hypothetical protein
MRQAASPPPRPERLIYWLPLSFFFSVAFMLWFATTFIILLPQLIPGMSHQHDAREVPGAPVAAVLMLVIFQICFVLLIVSSARAVLTAPGEIPSWLRSDGQSDLHSYSNLLQATERKRDGTPRFCRKTGAYKPDRSHYCPEVGSCVLQFQAFSMPLNSAIGFYNYKYFLLSCFYATVCAAWVVASTLPEVMASSAPLSNMPRDPALQDGLSVHAIWSQLGTVGSGIIFPTSDRAHDQWMVSRTHTHIHTHTLAVASPAHARPHAARRTHASSARVHDGSLDIVCPLRIGFPCRLRRRSCSR